MFKFDLQIPFIHIYTAVLYEHYESMCRSYIEWRFQIYKWNFSLFWGRENEHPSS